MRFLRTIRVILALALAVAPVQAVEELAAAIAGKTVKVLTVGNSFARDASTFLPEMAKAGGHDLLLFGANPGGCSLEMHAGWIEAHKRDAESPEGQPYPAAFVPEREDIPEGKMYSLAEILAAEDWDFVTIQQLSNLSFKEGSFEPYAKTIIDCIRENAPGAEILIHQTWAYREDYPGFAEGKFTQSMMFDELEANYKSLAERYGLRVIPVGKAFQEARSLPKWTFRFPDPEFNYKAPELDSKPDQSGSLNIGWTIQKIVKKVPGVADSSGAEVVPEEDVTYAASLDFKHCNLEGQFLGSSVWYGFLFGEDVSQNTFSHPWVDPADATALRGISDHVLREYKQVASAREK